MAQICQPGKFDVKHPEEWERYLGLVELGFQAKQITEDNIKKSTLLCTCGTELFRLAQDLCFPTTLEDVSYSDLKAKLNEYFKPQRSELAWRFQFARRVQQPGESAAEYIGALQQAALPCKFPDFLERLRDQIVFGLRDKDLRRELLVRPNLTFQQVRRELMVHELGEPDVQQPQPRRGDPGTQRKPAGRPNATPAKCPSCGRSHARVSACKFRTATCWTCGKTGHIAAVCWKHA